MIDDVGTLEQAAQAVESDNRSSYDSDEVETPDELPSEDVVDDSSESDSDGDDEVEKEFDFKGTKHTVKTDGKDEVIDYAELVRRASHGKAAAKRMQEASEYRKEADKIIADKEQEVSSLKESVNNFTTFIRQMREEPDLILQLGTEIGVNFEEWAHRKVLQKIQYQNMSEVERRAHDLEQENKRFKDDRAKAEKREAELKKAQEFKAAQNKVASEMVDYLESKGIEQADPNILERALEIMKLTKSKPEGRWPFAKAFEYAQKELSNKVDTSNKKSFLERAKNGELSDDEIKAFREFDQRNFRKKAVTPTQSTSRKPVTKYRTIDEAFKDL